MGWHWLIRCPYCNCKVAGGRGKGDFPDIWVPFIRCNVCGNLIRTNCREYLTLTVDERTRLRNNRYNSELIEKSLDRTNNQDYLSILQQKGYKIYPVTDQDKNRFCDVQFHKFDNGRSSLNATETLENVGVLIDGSLLDNKTGAFKEEIYDKNKSTYNKSKKILRWSVGTGCAVGFILAWLFSYINQYLAILGIAIGIGCIFAVYYGMDYYYRHKEDSNDNHANNYAKAAKKSEQDVQQYLALIEKCGINFFIKYYRQIARLPLKDVAVTESYSSAEREERLFAAKKIIDLGLSELALSEIIRAYDDILDKEVIDLAKELLNEIQKPD